MRRSDQNLKNKTKDIQKRIKIKSKKSKKMKQKRNLEKRKC